MRLLQTMVINGENYDVNSWTKCSTCQLVISSIISSRSKFVVSFILSLVVPSSCRLSNSSHLFVLLIGYFHLRSFRHVACLFVCLFIASCVVSSRQREGDWELCKLSLKIISNMAAAKEIRDPVSELKKCLRFSIEMVQNRLKDRIHDDMDGIDYLCVQLDIIKNLAERASAQYNLLMAMDIVNSLRKAQESLRSLERGNEHISVFVSTGCRGRPFIHIPKDLVQLYIDYHFPLTKIGQIFGVFKGAL